MSSLPTFQDPDPLADALPSVQRFGLFNGGGQPDGVSGNHPGLVIAARVSPPESGRLRVQIDHGSLEALTYGVSGQIQRDELSLIDAQGSRTSGTARRCGIRAFIRIPRDPALSLVIEAFETVTVTRSRSVEVRLQSGIMHNKLTASSAWLGWTGLGLVRFGAAGSFGPHNNPNPGYGAILYRGSNPEGRKQDDQNNSLDRLVLARLGSG